MRVRGEAVVSMLRYAVEVLPALALRVDVNHHPAEMRQVVEELVADFLGDLVTFPDGAPQDIGMIRCILADHEKGRLHMVRGEEI